MLESEKKEEKKFSQALLSSFLSSENIIPSTSIGQAKTEEEKYLYRPPTLYYNLRLKSSSYTKSSIYVKYEDASKVIINRNIITLNAD